MTSLTFDIYLRSTPERVRAVLADPGKVPSETGEPLEFRGVRAAWRGGILVRDHGRYTRARCGRARPEPRERWDGCT